MQNKWKNHLKKFLEFLEENKGNKIEIIYSETLDGVISSLFLEKILEVYTNDYVMVPFSVFNKILPRVNVLIFLDIPYDVVKHVDKKIFTISHEKLDDISPFENWINPHCFGMEYNTTRIIYEIGRQLDNSYFSERQWLVNTVTSRVYDFGDLDLPSIFDMIENYGIYGNLFYASIFKEKSLDRVYTIFYSAFKYNDDIILKNNYYLKNCYSYFLKYFEKELSEFKKIDKDIITIHDLKYIPSYFSFLIVENFMDNGLYIFRDKKYNIEVRSLVKQSEIEVFVNLFGGFYYNPRYATLLYSKNMFNEIREILKQRPLDMYF